ncbi:MAG: extracellular solute-binding protein [Pirellulaceae bacterium]|nr:extracellular solute-binding protein [Planctomycetales bacterium]
MLTRNVRMYRINFAAIGIALMFAQTGCLTSPKDGTQIIVYTAHDQTFSEPILQSFEARTNVHVRAKFDVESTKTVGLVNEIMAESSRPRCDVFWNNEILNSLRLKKAGLLDVYFPAIAKDYPEHYQDTDGTWYGFAARARILLYNTELLDESPLPESIYDLANERWKGKIGIAKPLFGTTATHVACLFSAVGPDEARRLLDGIKANQVQILGGNKRVAEAVAHGQLAFGLTDTDDAMSMIRQGYPVDIVYPDQRPDQVGTLFIPNTVCVIKNGPHPTEARKMVDFLLSPEVEIALAKGPSAQVPLNSKVTVTPAVKTPTTIKAMRVSFQNAADAWDSASDYVQHGFLAE